MAYKGSPPAQTEAERLLWAGMSDTVTSGTVTISSSDWGVASGTAIPPGFDYGDGLARCLSCGSNLGVVGWCSICQDRMNFIPLQPDFPSKGDLFTPGNGWGISIPLLVPRAEEATPEQAAEYLRVIAKRQQEDEEWSVALEDLMRG